jgi:hypothetical protein
LAATLSAAARAGTEMKANAAMMAEITTFMGHPFKIKWFKNADR